MDLSLVTPEKVRTMKPEELDKTRRRLEAVRLEARAAIRVIGMEQERRAALPRKG